MCCGHCAIGPYVIEAELSGFQRHRREGLTLTTGATVPLDIQLPLGERTETVTVQAEAPLLSSRTSEVSQLIESRSVEGMPLGDRRSLNLISITGGAVLVGYDAGAKPNFSLAGGRTQSQMFWIDGGTAQNMRLGIGQVDMDPPVETLSEVKVLSSAYAAEFGGSDGGTIIATTKSAPIDFHGSLFEYFRNDKLDAPGFFAPIQNGEKTARSSSLQRLRRDARRTDQPRQDILLLPTKARGEDGHTRTLTVPTALQRKGDFSQTLNARGNLVPIYDPATTSGNVRAPFQGNLIPPDRFDPVALGLLALPASKPPAGQRQRREQLQREWHWPTRARQLHDRKWTTRLRRTRSSPAATSITATTNSRPASTPSGRGHSNRHSAAPELLLLGYTRTFGAALMNEIRFTYTIASITQCAGAGRRLADALGLTGVPDEAYPRFTSRASRRKGQPITNGGNSLSPAPIRQQSVVRPRTTRPEVRCRGAAVIQLRGQSPVDLWSVCVRHTADGAAQPLGHRARHGEPAAWFSQHVTIRETEVLDRSSWYLAAFVQDDWTVGPSLTLNVGIRWETDTPIVDANDRMNGFDPSRDQSGIGHAWRREVRGRGRMADGAVRNRLEQLRAQVRIRVAAIRA